MRDLNTIEEVAKYIVEDGKGIWLLMKVIQPVENVLILLE